MGRIQQCFILKEGKDSTLKFSQGTLKFFQMCSTNLLGINIKWLNIAMLTKKISSSHLDKLNSAIKNATGVTQIIIKRDW